jgi:7-cyano-7-deazaguanine reductase
MANSDHILLGKPVDYPEQYAPDVLCAVPRQIGREALGLSQPLPFFGVDIWNAYELSWLDLHGKPQVAVGEIIVPCESPNLIESKSLKLYFNSFNLTRIAGIDEFVERTERDLSACAGAPVSVRVRLPKDWASESLHCVEGVLIDDLTLTVDGEPVADPRFLKTCSGEIIEETLTSNLLRSCCPVTGQPDWASVVIHYRGKAIDREGLLRYIIGFRKQHEFHEQCVERLFCDIRRQLEPDLLGVQARYTRRGGLDINPLRTTETPVITNRRWYRQ